MFGAMTVSSLSAPFQGTWRYGGVEFVDDIVRIEIITERRASLFQEFKATVKKGASSIRYPYHTPVHSYDLSRKEAQKAKLFI
jgi:hypothetical protein